MNSKVNITNVQTNTLKTLNKEECLKLINEYKNGNKSLKDELIVKNLKLILTVIKKINYSYSIDPDDLFQVGCIGLIKSIDNFNVDLNVAFSTYAVPMITGEIKRYLRDNNNVKISRQIKDLAYRILKEKETYISNHNKEPSNSELAKILDVDVNKINEAINSLNCVVSLQESITHDENDEITYLEHLSDEYDIKEKIINRITLKEAINSLNDLQKKIIIKRYYSGFTQEEIANELFISQAQVSRLEKNALAKLKEHF